MPTFERGDLVKIAFPFTDRDVSLNRPALVLSNGGVGPGGSLLWVAMITSAANRSWDDDVPVPPETDGLDIPSAIRTAKISTVDADRATRLGRVDERTLARVMTTVRRRLA
jgi:mRNA interferase MazF